MNNPPTVCAVSLETPGNIRKMMAEMIAPYSGPGLSEGSWFEDRSHRRGIAASAIDNGEIFFRDPSSDLTVALAGRITNRLELEAEYTDRTEGRTAGCAELAARLYLRFGFNFVNLLHGYFGIIIWDGGNERLLAYRDHAGFFPLFYAIGDRAVAVASSVKALLKSGTVTVSYDYQAINYFICDKAFEGEDTPFKQIRALKAGEAIIYEEGNIRTERYYHFPIRKIPMTEKEAIEKADTLLIQLLEEYTGNFDQIGLLLSGGVDSMLLLSALRQVTDKPLRTYSVSVKTGARDNEYVKKASSHFGTDHTDIPLDESAFRRYFEDLAISYPTPAVGAWHIYLGTRAAANDGVRGVFTGFGGELIFGIPPAYRYFEILHSILGFLNPLNPAQDRLLKTFGGLGRMLERAIPPAGLLGRYSDLRRGIQSWLGSKLPEKRVHRMFPEGEEKFCPVRYTYIRDYQESGADNLTDTLLYSRLKHFEGNKVLGKCNGIAWRNGVELLIPFMDRRMVEFGFSIPHRLKGIDGRYRYLEHRLAEKYHSFERKKSAFIVPFSDWLRGNPPPEARAVFEPDRINRTGIFKEGEMQNIWNDFQKGDPDITWADIFAFISLDIWLEEVMQGCTDHGTASVQ